MSDPDHDDFWGDSGPECGWLKEPGDPRYGCQLPAGHFGNCSAKGGVVTAPAEAACPRCNGDGVEGCTDPLQCCARHCDGSAHECPDCSGRGLLS